VARLVLVGLPGVGKSALALALASTLDCGSLDTDDQLASDVGMAAGEYLRIAGVEKFRDRELDALRRALRADAVVATGAGVIENGAARDLLREQVTVWLDCDDEILVTRVADGDRPLLGADPRSALAALRGRRETWYRAVARVRVDASGTLDEVVARIKDAVVDVAR
jgi:shikimate kinase